MHCDTTGHLQPAQYCEDFNVKFEKWGRCPKFHIEKELQHPQPLKFELSGYSFVGVEIPARMVFVCKSS